MGSDRVRTTPLQNILLLDVPGDRIEDAVAGLRALGIEPDPGPLTRSMLACTGLAVCKTRTPQRNGGYAGFTLRGV